MRPPVRTIASLFLAAAMHPVLGTAQESPSGHFGLDHVIISTGILREGIAEFARRTGVTPSFGGKHPGRGTQNALVSLGRGRYLELLAPVVDSSSAGPLVVSGWALHTDQVDALGATLKPHGFAVSPLSPGSRQLPDGALLKWTTAALVDTNAAAAPFFIHWDSGSIHPSKSSPQGCVLERVTLTDVPPFRTIDLLKALDLDIPVERGKEPGLTLVLQCPKGRVTFGDGSHGNPG